MNLRQSLYLSITVHLLLLGGGLTFVSLSRIVYGLRPDAIIVSVVGEGRISGHDHDATERLEHDSRRFTQVAREERTPAPLSSAENMPQRAMSGDIQPLESTGVPNSPKGGAVGGAELSDGMGAETVASATENATIIRGQPGLFPSEQWTAIRRSIERAKTYPRLAREMGIQGVVYVRFRLKPSGDVERVEIVKSSGCDILDSATVRTVYRAAPMPYVEGWLEVPISYVLE